jgi:hypothetical protein
MERMWTADANLFVKNVDSINLVSLYDVGGTLTKLICDTQIQPV